MITILCYEKCSTCQKALKWLDDHKVKYITRPIKEEHPTLQEIKKWHQLSNLDIRKFFNTSGILYREMKLSEKLNNMPLSEQYKLLASDGMLVKRPLLISDNKIIPGFKEDKWLEAIK